jgi:hypothetical protein
MALKKAAKLHNPHDQPTAIKAAPRMPSDTGSRPSKLRFEHKRHMYFDGRTWLPSVTGIAGKIEDKGGLLNWYANTVATCAIEEAAELSRLRRLDGDDAAQDWLSKAADRERDRKAVAGSDLHDIADRKLSGMELPDDLHDDVRAMADNVLAFMSDYSVTVLHSEVRLCNRSLGYAGTTDQIGLVPQYGRLPVMIDWKTGESMYRNPKFSHGKNALQLAAYAGAEVMFWDDKTEDDMVKVNQDTGLIVMIRPEGYKVYDYDLTRAWPQFRRAFESYHWWRDSAELARGPVRPRRELCPTCLGRDPLPACDCHGLDLMGRLRAVKTEAALDALYDATHKEWTDAHIDAGRAVAAELRGVAV